MRIYNRPSSLTYEEKAELKKAKKFMERNKEEIFLTDNGVWWYCDDPAGAKEYLITNGVEEIPYNPVK